MEAPHFIGTLYLGIDFFSWSYQSAAGPEGEGRCGGLPFNNKLQSSPPPPNTALPHEAPLSHSWGAEDGRRSA